MLNQEQRIATADVAICAVEEVVAKAHGLSRSDLLARRRFPAHSEARREAWWIVRNLTTLSLPDIGAPTGHDHASVVRGIDKVDQQRAADPAYAARVDSLAAHAKAVSETGFTRAITVVDAVAAAERVAVGGARQAIALSTLEVIAVCVRAGDLEQVAGGAFQVLALFNRLWTAAPEQVPAIRDTLNALIPNLAGALEALGYQEEPENGNEAQA